MSRPQVVAAAKELVRRALNENLEAEISSGYKISPEALQRCLREHLSDLQKRNIRSANTLAVFQQYCYVPKHTVGEQLLQVREAKREQAAYEAATGVDI